MRPAMMVGVRIHGDRKTRSRAAGRAEDALLGTTMRTDGIRTETVRTRAEEGGRKKDEATGQEGKKESREKVHGQKRQQAKDQMEAEDRIVE